jgi:hypothetical protein
MKDPKYSLDLDKWSDVQLVTFHRQYVISNGEFIEAMRDRGHSDEHIRGLAMANVAVRNPDIESLDYLH